MARNRQRARDRKKLHRENIPGSLDNVSGEVDAAEASIVAGAAGIPDDTGALERDPAVEEERLGGGAGDVATTAAPAPARKRGGARLWHFLGACWAELQRVDWPDRRQVGQATAVVLGFVAVAGAFLGLADVVAQRLVDLIL